MNLFKNDTVNEEFKRKRKRDQQREDKIKHVTEQLKSDENMSPERFLEAMANKDVLPGAGTIIIL